MQFVLEITDGSVLWTAKAMNALDHVTIETMKNGVETTANVNASTGWLLGSQSVAHGDGDRLIQKWSYGFDEAGHLLKRDRADAINPATSRETFTYDALNRLKTSTTAVSDGYNKAESFFYDNIGNVIERNGKDYFYKTGCMAGTRP